MTRKFSDVVSLSGKRGRRKPFPKVALTLSVIDNVADIVVYPVYSRISTLHLATANLVHTLLHVSIL